MKQTIQNSTIFHKVFDQGGNQSGRVFFLNFLTRTCLNPFLHLLFTCSRTILTRPNTHDPRYKRRGHSKR
jgi:hypothetical protein